MPPIDSYDANPTPILGTSDDGTLLGTNGPDQIVSNPDDDTLPGTNGPGQIPGNPGDGVLPGTDETNQILGTPGNDALLGTNGPDQISGLDGVDVLIGLDGNDTLDGGNGGAGGIGDVLLGGNGDDQLIGGAAGDVLNGENGDDTLSGGGSPDILIGGDGNDGLLGGPGADLLVGGSGQDTFSYNGDPFDGATPSASAEGQIPGVDNPDTIADFTPADDTFSLDADSLGLQGFGFANAQPDLLSGDANVVVLQGEFADPSAAAEAIAGNDALTGGAGVFLYHDTTLDFNRLVYSSDLAGGGSFSVLANLVNQTGDAGTALLPDYSSQNFNIA